MPNAVTHDTREERFNALYTRYKDTVRRCIEIILKDNCELYDDAEQETWIKAWRGMTPERYVGPAWLYRIGSNVAYDALRKKYHVGNTGRYGQRKSRPLPESLDADPETYEMLEAKSSDIDRFHNYEDIRTMLELMEPEHRQICLLFVSGMRYREIMRHFHCSKVMVWSIIRQLHERSRKARAEALV